MIVIKAITKTAAIILWVDGEKARANYVKIVDGRIGLDRALSEEEIDHFFGTRELDGR